MKKIIKTALLSFGIMTFLCGILYTTAITGIAQLIFPYQANGSVIIITLADGTQKEYGSELIAQEFTKPEYMIGRPMGTTNLSSVSEEQEQIVQDRVDWLRSIDPFNNNDIPSDLITASGSGVDPNISLEAAEYQVERIARERGMTIDEVREIINKYTTERFLGLWGNPVVNVLKVNLTLDGLL